VWGSSSTPGPNAPLSNACGTSSQPADSAQAALNQWTKAGFPANKLLLGLPTYGYVSQSTATHLSGSYRLPGPGLTAPTNAHTERVLAAGGVAGPSDDVEVSIPEGETASEPAAGPKYLNGAHDRSFEKAMASKRVHRPIPEATAGNLSSYENQQIPFNQIVALGALKKSGGAYNGTNGYTEGWDNCSDTPVYLLAAQRHITLYLLDDSFCSTRRGRRSSRTTTRTRSGTRQRSRRATAWPGASRGRSTR
jgi:chitinase